MSAILIDIREKKPSRNISECGKLEFQKLKTTLENPFLRITELLL